MQVSVIRGRLLAVVVNFFFRIFLDYLPGFPVKWVVIGLAAGCVVFSFAWAMVKRPTREAAAAAIDEKLRQLVRKEFPPPLRFDFRLNTELA